jgi:Flp pilus assembly protein TadD
MRLRQGGARQLRQLSLLGSLTFLLFSTAISADPKALSAALQKANDALNRGRLAEAERDIENVARLAPGKPDAANLRGTLFSKQGKFDEAEREFEKALQTDPNFNLAKYNLAELALLQGRLDEARTRFLDLQKLDSGSEVLQFKLVLCDVLQHQEIQAISGTEKINFPGRTPAYYFARAAILFQKNQVPQAKQYLANARKYYTDEQCAYFDQALREVKLVTSSATVEKGKK